MKTMALLLFILFLAWLALRKAPLGYESKTGFHLGHKKPHNKENS